MSATTTVLLEQLSEVELRQKLEAQIGDIRDRSKVLKRQLWTSIQAGRILLTLKQRCRHGEFDAAKIAKGLNRTAAHRYMSLAKSPKFSQCENLEQVGRVTDLHEWRSMRNVLDAHRLVRSKPSTSTVDLEIDDVEMCRYSGGYLFRFSVNGDDQFVGDRVELAMETKSPSLARALRDFGYRLLNAIKRKDGKPILCDRTYRKWQAYKEDEGVTHTDIPIETDEPEARELMTQVVDQVEALNMCEEFGALLPALREHANAAN